MAKRDIGRAFGLVVRDNRTRLKLSQEEVAERAQIHPTHVGLIERGERTPTLGVAEALAIAVGNTLSGLIAEAEALLQKNAKGSASLPE